MAQLRPHDGSTTRGSGTQARRDAVLLRGRAARANVGRPANDNQASFTHHLVGAGLLSALLAGLGLALWRWFA